MAVGSGRLQLRCLGAPLSGGPVVAAPCPGRRRCHVRLKLLLASSLTLLYSDVVGGTSTRGEPAFGGGLARMSDRLAEPMNPTFLPVHRVLVGLPLS